MARREKARALIQGCDDVVDAHDEGSSAELDCRSELLFMVELRGR